MTPPRRRALQRPHNSYTHRLGRMLNEAPLAELGYAALQAELRDAGWPTTTPEGDRTPHTGPPDDGNSLDYNDPTGDNALRLERMAADLDTVRTHMELVETSWHAMSRILERYVPAPSNHAPACSITTCDQTVEAYQVRQGKTKYIGMEQVLLPSGEGVWVAKPGVKPVCSKHRPRSRRSA